MKKLCLIFISICFVICTKTVIHADYPSPTYLFNMQRGVGNVTYTVNGSASTYTSYINSAANS